MIVADLVSALYYLLELGFGKGYKLGESAHRHLAAGKERRISETAIIKTDTLQPRQLITLLIGAPIFQICVIVRSLTRILSNFKISSIVTIKTQTKYFLLISQLPKHNIFERMGSQTQQSVILEVTTGVVSIISADHLKLS